MTSTLCDYFYKISSDWKLDNNVKIHRFYLFLFNYTSYTNKLPMVNMHTHSYSAERKKNVCKFGNDCNNEYCGYYHLNTVISKRAWDYATKYIVCLNLNFNTLVLYTNKYLLNYIGMLNNSTTNEKKTNKDNLENQNKDILDNLLDYCQMIKEGCMNDTYFNEFVDTVDSGFEALINVANESMEDIEKRFEGKNNMLLFINYLRNQKSESEKEEHEKKVPESWTDIMDNESKEQ